MKKMKHYMAIAGLILAMPVSLFAQKGAINVGAHAGVSISRLCCGSMEMNKDYKFGEGPAFGLTGSYGLNDRFSLVAELNYATLGGKKDGMQAMNGDAPILYADFENKIILNYLELPVMARITFGDKFKYYANAGVFGGYLLSARQKASGTSAIYLDKDGTQPYTSENEQSFDLDEDIADEVNPFNFGLTGGLGAGYTFGRHGIWLDGRYNLGIPNILRHTDSNGENSTGSIMVLAGYTFRISK